MNENCHYGDHDFERNGRCRHCDAFNGGWLAYQAEEKAQRAGLAHKGHFHRTEKAAAACRYPKGTPEYIGAVMAAEQQFNRIGDPDAGGPELDEVPF